jgi:hypothetical protein
VKFITTQPITIPAGTEFVTCDDHGGGGLRHMSDYGYMIVYLGRAEALRQGMVIAKPTLALVESPDEHSAHP